MSTLLGSLAATRKWGSYEEKRGENVRIVDERPQLKVAPEDPERNVQFSETKVEK